MRASKETMIATPADPDDAEDSPVGVTGLERGLMGRRTRMLRGRLGLSQEAFAPTYCIPLANIRQYKVGRHMPPPAVRAYLKVIEAEPERVARGVGSMATPPSSILYPDRNTRRLMCKKRLQP